MSDHDSRGREEIINGTGGDDVLYANGKTTELNGLDGNDLLFGGPKNDTLNGGAGNDVLIGGGGADFMSGGDDKIFMDVFYFDRAKDTSYEHTWDKTQTFEKIDHILDFNSRDMIVLANIDANTKVAGDQAFNFIGTASFTGKGAELHTWIQGGNMIVSGDTDGDKLADFGFYINADHKLDSTDFLL
jgi:Ca2+-binding RTX toxin-like protein